jgi:hypothetical protein
MQHSRVIEISGQFAGVAIPHEGKFRFIAIDTRVEELDDSIWPTVADVRRVVRRLMTTSSLPSAPSGPLA